MLRRSVRLFQKVAQPVPPIVGAAINATSTAIGAAVARSSGSPEAGVAAARATEKMMLACWEQAQQYSTPPDPGPQLTPVETTGAPPDDEPPTRDNDVRPPTRGRRTPYDFVLDIDSLSALCEHKPWMIWASDEFVKAIADRIGEAATNNLYVIAVMGHYSAGKSTVASLLVQTFNALTNTNVEFELESGQDVTTRGISGKFVGGKDLNVCRTLLLDVAGRDAPAALASNNRGVADVHQAVSDMQAREVITDSTAVALADCVVYVMNEVSSSDQRFLWELIPKALKDQKRVVLIHNLREMHASAAATHQRDGEHKRTMDDVLRNLQNTVDARAARAARGAGRGGWFEDRTRMEALERQLLQRNQTAEEAAKAIRQLQTEYRRGAAKMLDAQLDDGATEKFIERQVRAIFGAQPAAQDQVYMSHFVANGTDRGRVYTSTWNVGDQTMFIEHYVLFNRYTSDEHNEQHCRHLARQLFIERGRSTSMVNVVADMYGHCKHYTERHLDFGEGAVPDAQHDAIVVPEGDGFVNLRPLFGFQLGKDVRPRLFSVAPFLIGDEARPRIRLQRPQGDEGQVRFQIDVPGMTKESLLIGPDDEPPKDRRAKSWVHIELKEDQGQQRLCLKGYRKMGSSGYDFSDEVSRNDQSQRALFGFDWDASPVDIADGVIDIVLQPRVRKPRGRHAQPQPPATPT